MSNTYTVEVYKKDNRFKSGERLFEKVDIPDTSKETIDFLCARKYRAADGYRYEIHKTYVKRTNHLTREKFTERYDTPYYCSPSSETFWST